MFYLRLINRKCAKEKKQQYLMLYQTWNRTPVYFKLAVSASYHFFLHLYKLLSRKFAPDKDEFLRKRSPVKILVLLQLELWNRGLEKPHTTFLIGYIKWEMDTFSSPARLVRSFYKRLEKHFAEGLKWSNFISHVQYILI